MITGGLDSAVNIGKDQLGTSTDLLNRSKDFGKKTQEASQDLEELQANLAIQRKMDEIMQNHTNKTIEGVRVS